MYILNEASELVDSHAYAKELFIEGFGFGAVSETEAEDAFAMLYETAVQNQLNEFMESGPEKENFMGQFTILPFDRKKLWRILKEYFCKFIKEDSNFKDILTQIIDAIAGLIPGGKLIKELIKIIIRFLFGEGMKLICP